MIRSAGLMNRFVQKFFNMKIRNGYIYNLLVILCLLFAVNATYNALSWYGKTFPGFLLYNPVIVSDVSLSHWAQHQGYDIQPYDTIVKVNDIKVESSRHVYEIVSSLPVGTEINYEIVRGGEVLGTAIPSMTFQGNYIFNIFGVELVVGLVFLFLGFMVYNLKPTQLVSKVFFGVCLSLAVWFIADFDYQTTYSLIYSFNWQFFAQFITAAFLILFAFTFPSPSRYYVNYKKFFVIPFAVSGLLFFTQLLFLKSGIDGYWNHIYLISYIYVFAATLTVLASLVINYRNPSNIVDRERSKVVLVGALFGFCIPALLAVFFVIFHVSNLVYLVIPILFFPASIAYAIIKHKLFDIHLIVKKTLVYGLTTASVAAVFILFFFGISLIFTLESALENPFYLLLLSIAVVVAVNPLKNLVQKSVDAMFSRSSYDYESAVSEFSTILSSLLKIKNISAHITDTLNRTLMVSSAALFIVNRESGDFEISDSIPPEKYSHKTLETERIKSLLDIFSREKREIFKEDVLTVERYSEHEDSLLELFSEMDASIAFPMYFKEDLLGILFLGGKRSEQMYTADDVKFLRTVVSQSTIAIENSFSFELVEDYAEELEKKNQILKNIQEQLIHAEKMSAIGYLASGIAHEIRNPLNIIEGARYYLSSQLENGGNDESAGEYLEYIQNEVMRTNRLIDQLLNFAKVEHRNSEDIDINSLIENVIVLSRKQFEDSGVNVKKTLKQQLPKVRGDSGQLWQVLINVLINSIQSIRSEGEIHIESGLIENYYTLGGGYVYVKITDNGSGIDEQDLTRVFDPFFTRKSSGTGLGLSVSYKIIESHNGSILVSSNPGEGSSFIIQLPLENNNKNEVMERAENE